ncbi:MAG: hypothetical protein AAGF12_40035 [Myxococcota bacterium]
MSLHPAVAAIALSASVFAAGCAELLGEPPPGEEEAPIVEPAPPRAPEPRRVVDSRPPPPLDHPVDVYRDGTVFETIETSEAVARGLVVFDLGEDWTPYIFTERDAPDAEEFAHSYRDTYLSLARGEFPEDHHGDRARRDKYLELYGIPPTLGLIRSRLRAVNELECAAELDLDPLVDFDGFVAYRNNDRARRNARTFAVVERQTRRILEAQGVESVDDIDRSALDDRQVRNLRDYIDDAPEFLAIRAAQDRLECEGFFEGKRSFQRGAFDWATHEALAEFERRHRVYGWGFIGRDTLDALRRTPAENEVEAVVRVLTERAIHAAGVIEDGSIVDGEGEPRTFRGADGEQHPIPNLEEGLRTALIDAFGLTAPEPTLAFLESLERLRPGEEILVAFEGPELPEYYDSDMELTVEVDRGDVWYDFPYDESGAEQPQPVQRRPRQTIFTEYLGERVPLARFGTTIGGWRSEFVEGTIMWKYKNSPVGPRVWHQIVSAPVWLPPEGTPHRSLLSRTGRGGADAYRINYHEMGPSYASAYGLVAAYHKRFVEEEDGTIRYSGDEGIRTHGSVDYMSIMRRHSHGCHRLHNHIAVRLMSFVLAHRPHRRVGQQAIAFGRTLQHEGHSYRFDLTRGGYVFQLEEPVHVNVLPGRIRGQVGSPIETPLPRYDEEIGAYIRPDGQTVAVDRFGNVTEIELPPEEGEEELEPIDPMDLPLPGAPPTAVSPTSSIPASPSSAIPTPTLVNTTESP